MAMFRGVHNLSLDGKGRMAIPSRYRERLHDECGGRMVLTINPDEPCLWLYPLNEWEPIEAQLAQLPRSDRFGQQLKRRLMRYASDCQLDGSGRILLPPMLREFGELEKSMVLFGVSNKFEIWSEAHWLESEAVMEQGEIDESQATEASLKLVL